MAYSRQRADWKDWPDTSTVIRAQDLDGIEDGLVAAAATADSANTTANAAIPKPSSPGTSASLEYNGSSWVATRNVFNLMNYGAANDGSTNDATAFQAAVDAAASAGNGIVWGPPGTGYKINSQITVSTSKVIIMLAPGAEIIQGSSTGNILFTGSEGSAVTLSSNAAQGDITLTMTSTTGLAANDFLSLYSTADWPNTTNSSKQGEIVRVKSVDSATVVTLWGRIEDAYTTANSASIRKLSMLEGCGFFGGKISNPTPGTLALPAISAKWLKNFTVRDTRFEKIDGQGVANSAVIDSTFDNLGFFDLTDDTVNGRFGYGVSLVGPSQNNVVSNCVMRGGRHCVTHGGTSRGVARHNRTEACRATGMSAAGFDTHIESSHNTFSDCEAWGQFGTSEGYGFALGGPYSTMMDCRGGFLRQSIISINNFADNAVILGGRFGPQIVGVNGVFNQGTGAFIGGGAYFEDMPSTCINCDSGDITVDPSVRFRNCTTILGGTGAAGIARNATMAARSLTYSASISVDQRATINRITVTNGTAFTITNPSGTRQSGQTIVFDIYNNSGGAMGAITWGGQFKLAGAFTNPATGQHRTIIFWWDGSAWYEMNRAAADIPN